MNSMIGRETAKYKRGKPWQLILTAVLILTFSFSAFFGLKTQYGDTVKTWIKGASDIRFGVDIKGGVNATFKPADSYDATPEQMEAAQTVIENRLVALNITDYEIYADKDDDRIIVEFPWQSDESDFDPEAAIQEIGTTAYMTFRKGDTADGELILDGSMVESAEPAYGQVSNSGTSEYYVALTFTGKESNAREKYVIRQVDGSYKAFQVDPATGTESKDAYKPLTDAFAASGNGTYVITLDDIRTSGAHFHDILTTLTPGEDFTIAATVASGTAKPATAAKTTNSLFDSIQQNGTGYTAYIGNGRHLQNLEQTVSSLKDSADITQAMLISNIYWDEFTSNYTRNVLDQNNAEIAGGSLRSIISSGLSVVNGDGYAVVNMKAAANGSNAGLLAEAGTASREILLENLFLINPQVTAAGTGSAGALIGRSGPNAVIASCGVFASDGAAYQGTVFSRKGTAISLMPGIASAGGSAGGLIGKIDFAEAEDRSGLTARIADGIIQDAMKSGTSDETAADIIYASFASVKVTGNQAGGLIGEVTSNSKSLAVRDSYSGGCLREDGTYDDASANIAGTASGGGIAGLVSGSIDFENCYSTASASGAAAGGFTGTQSASAVYNNDYAAGKAIASGTSGLAGSFIGSLQDPAYLNSTPVKVNNVDTYTNHVLLGSNLKWSIASWTAYKPGSESSTLPTAGNHAKSDLEKIVESYNVESPFTSTATVSRVKYRSTADYGFTGVNKTAYDAANHEASSATTVHYGDWPQVSVGSVTVRKTLSGTIPADIMGKTTFDVRLGTRSVRISLADMISTGTANQYRFDLILPASASGQNYTIQENSRRSAAESVSTVFTYGTASKTYATSEDDTKITYDFAVPAATAAQKSTELGIANSYASQDTVFTITKTISGLRRAAKYYVSGDKSGYYFTDNWPSTVTFSLYSAQSNVPVSSISLNTSDFTGTDGGSYTLKKDWQISGLMQEGQTYYIRELSNEATFTHYKKDATVIDANRHYSADTASSVVINSAAGTASQTGRDTGSFVYHAGSSYAVSFTNTYRADKLGLLNNGVVQLQKTVPAYSDVPAFLLVQTDGGNVIQLTRDSAKDAVDQSSQTVTYTYSASTVPAGTYYIEENNADQLAQKYNVTITSQSCVNQQNKQYCTIAGSQTDAAPNRTTAFTVHDHGNDDARENYTSAVMRNIYTPKANSISIFKNLTYQNMMSWYAADCIPGNMSYDLIDVTDGNRAVASVSFAKDQFKLNGTNAYWQANQLVGGDKLIDGHQYRIREQGSEAVYSVSTSGNPNNNSSAWHISVNTVSKLTSGSAAGTQVTGRDSDAFTYHAGTDYRILFTNTYNISKYSNSHNWGTVKLKKTVPMTAENIIPAFQLVEIAGSGNDKTAANVIRLTRDTSRSAVIDNVNHTITYYYYAYNIPTGKYYVEETNADEISSKSHVRIKSRSCVVQNDTYSSDQYCSGSSQNWVDLSSTNPNAFTVNGEVDGSKRLTSVALVNTYIHTLSSDDHIGMLYYEKAGDSYYYHGLTNTGSISTVSTLDTTADTNDSGLPDIAGKTASEAGYLVLAEKGVTPIVSGDSAAAVKLEKLSDAQQTAMSAALGITGYDFYAVTGSDDTSFGSGRLQVTVSAGQYSISPFFTPYLGDSIAAENSSSYAIRSAGQWNWLAQYDSLLTEDSTVTLQQQLDIDFAAASGNGTVGTLSADLEGSQDENGVQYSMTGLTAPLVGAVTAQGRINGLVLDGIRFADSTAVTGHAYGVIGSNAGAISNLTVENFNGFGSQTVIAPDTAGSPVYVGIIGENTGSILGLTLTGIDMSAGDVTVAVTDPASMLYWGLVGDSRPVLDESGNPISGTGVIGGTGTGEGITITDVNLENAGMNGSSALFAVNETGASITNVTATNINAGQSGFVADNAGSIANCAIESDDTLTGSITSTVIGGDGFAGTNSGTITSCSVTAESIGASGFVNSNAGTISESTVVANTIADYGFVAVNEADGMLTNNTTYHRLRTYFGGINRNTTLSSIASLYLNGNSNYYYYYYYYWYNPSFENAYSPLNSSMNTLTSNSSAPSASPSASPSPSASADAEASASPSPSASATPSPEPSASAETSPSPSASSEPTAVPSASAGTEPSPSASPTATPAS